MTDSWLIRVYNDHVLSLFKECGGPMELGRQDDRAGESLFQVAALLNGGCRIAIARSDEVRVSRRLAWVERVSPRRVRIRNFSDDVAFGVEGGLQLKPGSECEVEFPVVLTLGNKVVRIQRAVEDNNTSVIQSLEKPTDFLHANVEPEVPFSTLNLSSSALPDMSSVIGWLRAMIRLLQSAANDADFFQKAAQAVVEVVGLDIGRVLTRDGDGWKTVALFPTRATTTTRTTPRAGWSCPRSAREADLLVRPARDRRGLLEPRRRLVGRGGAGAGSFRARDRDRLRRAAVAIAADGGRPVSRSTPCWSR